MLAASLRYAGKVAGMGLAASLAAALCVTAAPAGAAAGDKGLAPPVTRKPAAKPVERAPSPVSEGAAPCGTGTAAPCPSSPQPGGPGAGQASPEAYRRALEAAAPSAGRVDPALQSGLLSTLGRLMAAGRCTEATTLATSNGQGEVAGAVRRLCAAR